ncbi:MAG: hypothetical protein IPM52_05030 [Bacteroidetes bacterium]|nr:hypothetical protein [Bacteroidota bacterium]
MKKIAALMLFLFATLVTSTAPSAQNSVEISGMPDENSHALYLRLIRARQYMQSVQLVFELQNRMEWLKHCWLGVSFYDRDGEFLYRELPLMFTSLPEGRSQRQELWLESTDLADVGTLVLRPMLLETALRELDLDTTVLRVETVDKHQFKIVFEEQP